MDWQRKLERRDRRDSKRDRRRQGMRVTGRSVLLLQEQIGRRAQQAGAKGSR